MVAWARRPSRLDRSGPDASGSVFTPGLQSSKAAENRVLRGASIYPRIPVGCAAVMLRTRFTVSAARGSRSRPVVNTQPSAYVLRWVGERLHGAASMFGRRVQGRRLGAQERAATASGLTALDEKTRRRLHRRSPSSIERCIVAHEAVDRRADASVFPGRRAWSRESLRAQAEISDVCASTR